ncbi:MAG: SAM-dependent methyltransferase [Thermoproteota archaeon]|nr:MAG: SAM-dependent methyltransferase [Candidatus Korarchaeota archaeon]RLG55642.1 MAG: SAM-dependent methyltransferase [Candidatus Korarchaeota archaeon]
MSHAPFVPTPEPVVRKMLELAEVKPGEVVYDLGAGDGRIVIMAARDFGARAVAVEIRRDLCEVIRKKVEDLGLQDRVKVLNMDMFKVDLSDADVITLFLLTSTNNMLRPKFEKELRNGVRIVSHEFSIEGWRPAKVIDFHEAATSHRIYLYRFRRQRRRHQ